MAASTTPPPWANRIVGHGEVAPADLVPNPLNWRQHPQHQSDALEDVLTRIGLVATVLVNTRTGHLVDGHLRAELALRRGEPKIPVTYIDVDPEEERILLASLDPLAAMANADRERLAELLTSIQDGDDALIALLESIARQEGIDLPTSGGLVDEDEVPEPPAQAVTRPGDLWALGAHRLLCGDSTDPDHVTLLMGDERAVALLTDPPYLVDYDGKNHLTVKADGRTRPSPPPPETQWDHYIDHAHGVQFYTDFLCTALAHALSDRPALYQWFGMMRAPLVFEAWVANDVLPHQVVLWRKPKGVLGRTWFMYDYEPCMVGWPKGRQPTKDRRPPASATACWEIAQREGVESDLGSVHPTIKPVETVRRPIEWHTKPGELIYEPFSGSGTAIIAAETTGRRCYAMELAPEFVDVAVDTLATIQQARKRPSTATGAASPRSRPSASQETQRKEMGDEPHLGASS